MVLLSAPLGFRSAIKAMASGGSNGMKLVWPSEDCDEGEWCPQAVQVALPIVLREALQSEEGAVAVMNVATAEGLPTQGQSLDWLDRGRPSSPAVSPTSLHGTSWSARACPRGQQRITSGFLCGIARRDNRFHCELRNCSQAETTTTYKEKPKERIELNFH